MTNRSFLEFVLDNLSRVGSFTHKRMMGEYIIYRDGALAAYVCDDRLLVKNTPAARNVLPEAELQLPYEGAKKEMLYIEDVENINLLREVFDAIQKEQKDG